MLNYHDRLRASCIIQTSMQYHTIYVQYGLHISLFMVCGDNCHYLVMSGDLAGHPCVMSRQQDNHIRPVYLWNLQRCLSARPNHSWIACHRPTLPKRMRVWCIRPSGSTCALICGYCFIDALRHHRQSVKFNVVLENDLVTCCGETCIWWRLSDGITFLNEHLMVIDNLPRIKSSYLCKNSNIPSRFSKSPLASLHVAQAVRDFLVQLNTDLLQQHAVSLDLSPIRYVWDEMSCTCAS